MHKSSCPHVITIGDWSPADIADKEKTSRCETCGEDEAGLWCCLHRDCGYVGCGEKRADHSAAHFSSNQEHSLMINLKSKRIWCHTCEAEVYLDNNVPAPCRSSLHPDIAESERPSDDLIQRPLGLAGLQNLGNTCYMNAALQALSNCPQLTQYFLNTPISPQVIRSDGRTQSANLAVSYSKMIQQMWHERRPPYAVPSGVAYGIKSVCPVFRGATQQDAQEFLRCFLDQLHDELKREYIPKRSELDDAEGSMVSDARNVDRTTAGLDPALGSNNQHHELGASHRQPLTQHQYQPQLKQQLQAGNNCRGDHKRGGDPHSTQLSHKRHLQSSRNGRNSSGNRRRHRLLDDMAENEGDVDDDDEEIHQNSGLAIYHSVGHLHSSCSRNLNDLVVEVEDDEEVVDIEDADDEDDDEEMRSPFYKETGAGERIGGATSHKHARPHANHTTDDRPGEPQQHELEHRQIQHQHHNQLQQQQGHPQQGNAEDDFETCDSGLSSEKSEASASDKNHMADNQRAFETSLCNLLMGELQKAIASAGVSAVPDAAGSSVPNPKKPQVSYRSIISDVFDGRLLSSVQCRTCENISSTKEVFQDLSLPIPSRDHLERLHHVPHQSGDLSSASSSSSLNSLAAAQIQQQQSLTRQQGWIEWLFGWLWAWVWGPSVSLTDCLAAFFSADELKGDNMYSCGKCNKLRNGIKYSKLLELPEVLSIHLKRFRHELLFSTKISSRVSFPLEGLDMAPFTHPQARDKVTTYDLVAVICHHGTASSGHYTSYAKNEYDNQWYEFDDMYVTKVDPSVVATCEAYVLFYRKTSEEMAKRRDHATDLIERSQCEQLDETSPTFYISRRWVNRFNTFAEPGPIDNEEFVCPHGRLNPSVADGDLVLFSQSVWEYLRETFKGGPAITSTERCSYCLDIQRILLERRFAKFALSASQQRQQQQQQQQQQIIAADENIEHQQQIGLATGDVQPVEKRPQGHYAGMLGAAVSQVNGQLTDNGSLETRPGWSSVTEATPAAMEAHREGQQQQQQQQQQHSLINTESEESAMMDTSDTEETQLLIEQRHHQEVRRQQILRREQQQQQQQPQLMPQQHQGATQQHLQAKVLDSDDDNDDEEILSVERPVSIPIDNLLENVVLKMTSARVTDMISSQGLIEGTTIADIHRNGDGHRENIAEADSAFCSPIDSIITRDFSSLIGSTPTEVIPQVVTLQKTSPLINGNNCRVAPVTTQSMSRVANVIPTSLAPTDVPPSGHTSNKRASRHRRSRDKKAKNRW
ncbi:ubiquitin carboxyl-terminal hydrolase 20-like isoform X2 [Varroa destructor]|uniref:ubiquitinyl hydrolase 1 n=1 Tax=Varroa destructor TaxID=109461 RepID=A0A7M7KZH0_VARDE|nr:ubiquitin carboxyl-terminal hydrolase 20-like isoform X2 [Varroa destructor]